MVPQTFVASSIITIEFNVIFLAVLIIAALTLFPTVSAHDVTVNGNCSNDLNTLDTSYPPTTFILVSYIGCVMNSTIVLSRSNTGLYFERSSHLGVMLTSAPRSSRIDNVTIAFADCTLDQFAAVNWERLAFIVIPLVAVNVSVSVVNTVFNSRTGPFHSFMSNADHAQNAVLINVTLFAQGSNFTVVDGSDIVDSSDSDSHIAVVNMWSTFTYGFACVMNACIVTATIERSKTPEALVCCLSIPDGSIASLLASDDIVALVPAFVAISSRSAHTVAGFFTGCNITLMNSDAMYQRQISVFGLDTRAYVFGVRVSGDHSYPSRWSNVNICVDDCVILVRAAVALHLVFIDFGVYDNVALRIVNSAATMIAGGAVRFSSDGRRVQIVLMDEAQITNCIVHVADFALRSLLAIGVVNGANTSTYLRNFRVFVVGLCNVSNSSIALERVAVNAEGLDPDIVQWNAFAMSLGVSLVSITQKAVVGHSIGFSVNVSHSTIIANLLFACPTVRDASVVGSVSLVGTNGGCVGVAVNSLQISGSISLFHLSVTNFSLSTRITRLTDCNIVPTFASIQSATGGSTLPAGLLPFRLFRSVSVIHFAQLSAVDSNTIGVLVSSIVNPIAVAFILSSMRVPVVASDVSDGSVLVENISSIEAEPSLNTTEGNTALLLAQVLDFRRNVSIVIRGIYPPRGGSTTTHSATPTATDTNSALLVWNASIALFEENNVTNTNLTIEDVHMSASSLMSGPSCFNRNTHFVKFLNSTLWNWSVIVIENATCDLCYASDSSSALAYKGPVAADGDSFKSSAFAIVIQNSSFRNFHKIFGGEWNLAAAADAAQINLSCVVWDGALLGTNDVGAVGLPPAEFRLSNDKCYFEAPSKRKLIAAAAMRQVLTAAVGAGAVIASCGTLSLQVQQMNGILRVAQQCGALSLSAEDDGSASWLMEEPLDITMNVFQIGIGPSYGRYYRGAVVSDLFAFNTAAISCFVLVSYSFVAHRRAQEHQTLLPSATEFVAWLRATVTPAWFVGDVLPLFLQPLVTAGLSLLSYHSSPDSDVAVSVVLGLLAVITSVGSVVWCAVTLRRISGSLTATRRVKEGGDSHDISSPRVLRWLTQRRWRWASSPPDVLRRCGDLFESSSRGRHWWFAVELIIAVLFGAVGSVVVDEVSPQRRAAVCTAVTWINVAIAASLLCLAATLVPYDTRLDQSVLLFSGASSFALSVVAALNSSSDALNVVTTILFAVSLSLAAVKAGAAMYFGVKRKNVKTAELGLPDGHHSRCRRRIHWQGPTQQEQLERLIQIICQSSQKHKPNVSLKKGEWACCE